MGDYLCPSATALRLLDDINGNRPHWMDVLRLAARQQVRRRRVHA